MIDIERLKILTESAKYDVSCSSSGSRRQNTKDGMGNAAACGICHSFTPDGRCISLMKILLSNRCAYNCLYCPNRAEADVPRASATPDEICELVISFYKRNYIEGLFLSSAVDGSPDATMEKMLERSSNCAKSTISTAISISKAFPTPTACSPRARRCTPTA